MFAQVAGVKNTGCNGKLGQRRRRFSAPARDVWFKNLPKSISLFQHFWLISRYSDMLRLPHKMAWSRYLVAEERRAGTMGCQRHLHWQDKQVHASKGSQKLLLLANTWEN